MEQTSLSNREFLLTFLYGSCDRQRGDSVSNNHETTGLGVVYHAYHASKTHPAHSIPVFALGRPDTSTGTGTDSVNGWLTVLSNVTDDDYAVRAEAARRWRPGMLVVVVGFIPRDVKSPKTSRLCDRSPFLLDVEGLHTVLCEITRPLGRPGNDVCTLTTEMDDLHVGGKPATAEVRAEEVDEMLLALEASGARTLFTQRLLPTYVHEFGCYLVALPPGAPPLVDEDPRPLCSEKMQLRSSLMLITHSVFELLGSFCQAHPFHRPFEQQWATYCSLPPPDRGTGLAPLASSLFANVILPGVNDWDQATPELELDHVYALVVRRDRAGLLTSEWRREAMPPGSLAPEDHTFAILIVCVVGATVFVVHTALTAVGVQYKECAQLAAQSLEQFCLDRGVASIQVMEQSGPSCRVDTTWYLHWWHIGFGFSALSPSQSPATEPISLSTKGPSKRVVFRRDLPSSP